MFFGKTLYSRSAPLHPGVNGLEVMLGVTLQWINIPSRGSNPGDKQQKIIELFKL